MPVGEISVIYLAVTRMGEAGRRRGGGAAETLAREKARRGRARGEGRERRERALLDDALELLRRRETARGDGMTGTATTTPSRWRHPSF